MKTQKGVHHKETDMKESSRDRIRELENKIKSLEKENQALKEKFQQHSALEQDRTVLTKLANASHIAITVVNRDGNIVFVNEQAERILGLQKESISQRTYNDSEWKITDLDGNPFPDEQLPFQVVQSTQKPAYDIRHAIEWPDGRRVLLAINALPLLDENGEFWGMVNTLENITQQVQAETEFRELKILNEDIVQNAMEGIGVHDEHGIFIFFNPAGAAMLGYDPKELVGQHWKLVIPPDQVKIVEDADRRRMKGQTNRYELEMVRKDGARIQVLVSDSPRNDPETGKYIGALAIIADITQRKLAEKSLKESEARFRALSEATFEAIFISEKGICLEQNAIAEEMFGYTLEEAIGRPGTDWIAPEDREVVMNNMLTGFEDLYEVTALRKDGTTFPAEIHGRMAQYKGRKVRITALNNITERKHAELISRIQRELATNLNSTTGLQNIVDLCLETALDKTDMDAGGIYLIDQTSGGLILVSHRGLSPDFKEANIYIEANDPSTLRIMEGDPVYLAYKDLNLPVDNIRNQDGLKVGCSLPIKHENHIIAALNMASRSLEEIPSTTRDILEAIAVQIGGAIARARSEEVLKQRVDQLALINDIGEKIAAVLDLETVLDRTARLIQESFGYQHVSLFTKEKQDVVMKAISGDFIELFPKNHKLTIGQGLVGWVVVNNTTALANNVDENEHYVNLYSDIIKTRAELTVPIQIGGEVAGVIDVQSVHANTFDKSDVMVIETLADQVAVAIHNARLHEELQQELMERQSAEEALRESEVKFRNIFESNPMGMHMYQLEPDGRLVFSDANPAANDILGVDCKQFIGKIIEEAFPALTETEVPEMYRRAAGEGHPWQTDQIVYEENEISGAFDVYAFQTSPNRMAAMFLDITERMQIAKALEESEAKFRVFFRSINDAIFVHPLLEEGFGNFIEVNDTACDRYGYSKSEFYDLTIVDITKQEDVQVHATPTHRKSLREAGSLIFETVHIDKWGYHFPVEINSSIVEMNGQQFIMAVVRDITERIRAENSLRENKALLESLFRAAPTGIGLVSNRVLLRVNETILKMTGRTREELIGKDARLLYSTDEDYEYVGREKYRQIHEHGTGTVETRWQQKDGKIIDVLMSSTPIDPENLETGVTFTALDITERKRADQQIQTQLRRMAALRHIDTTITTSQELTITLDVILEQACNLLEVDAATILLLTPHTQQLEYSTGHGFLTNAIKNTRIQLGKGIAGRTALDRKPVIQPNMTEGSINFIKREEYESESFVAYGCIPLIAKGRVLGVLEIFNRSPLNPTPDWVDYLETLGGQAAIAIDNAELFNNLQQSNLELKLAYNSTLEGWSKALELRDFETKGHADRVTDLVIKLARKVGIPEDELDHVYRGALLHDIGKMGISDSILLKPGKLDATEWEIMKQHPVYAYEMLSSIEFLRPALDIPYCHHEKWDGSGYPRGLSGEAIPLAARVFAIIDVWDALSSSRPYRSRPWTKKAILDHIKEQSGKQFDPDIVPIFLELLEDE
jgi:PAS domain S-box-containing protein